MSEYIIATVFCSDAPKMWSAQPMAQITIMATILNASLTVDAYVPRARFPSPNLQKMNLLKGIA